MSIIENVRINQNYGKEEKKSSFIPKEQIFRFEENKITCIRTGNEYLSAHIIDTAIKWLHFAEKQNWKYYDEEGNAQDKKLIATNIARWLEVYFKEEIAP